MRAANASDVSSAVSRRFVGRRLSSPMCQWVGNKDGISSSWEKVPEKMKMKTDDPSLVARGSSCENCGSCPAIGMLTLHLRTACGVDHEIMKHLLCPRCALVVRSFCERLKSFGQITSLDWVQPQPGV